MSGDQTSLYSGDTQPRATSAGGVFLESFGRYRLLEKVGEGGMGVVYRAHDLQRDREVAVKVPRQDRGSKAIILPRFYREARLAARLAHPHLCPVLDVGEIDGVHYLTMPFVRGRRLLDSRGKDASEDARLIHTLALALAEAHRHHIIHRDLKPSNILIDEQGAPMVVDFGLAVCLGEGEERFTLEGAIVGTFGFMAPEQMTGEQERIGPRTDVYGLGAVYYWLLTGRAPADLPGAFPEAAGPRPPSQLRSDLGPRHDAVCLRALAPRPEDRFPDMLELADALAELAGLPRRPPPPRPPIDPLAVRFAFVGHGETAPRTVGPRDRIYLDVGNDLRPGVIDHHHLTSNTGSTTSLVLAYPGFLDDALRTERRPDDPVTFLLHRDPDLDAVASAYLAVTYLANRAFPAGAEHLARHVDELDGGGTPLSQANPFTLYAAYFVLGDRLLKQSWNSPQECWQEQVRLGMRLVEFALAQAVERKLPLEAVDAFACPGLFGPDDREEMNRDLERYRSKLADPRCHARTARLRLPGRFGGTFEAEALLVRDVQNADDPQRCIFFKHWARTDSRLSSDGAGFTVLSVFVSESALSARRCILSVPPGGTVSLHGLGARLEERESRRRLARGVDERVEDPLTGQPRPPRPGCANADPWYDGRAHDYTIVDSPRGGTWLSADEIEAALLEFGRAGVEAKKQA